MNIILTGGSSFTGYHIAKILASRANVYLPLRKSKIAYQKNKRSNKIIKNLTCFKNIKIIYNCEFGGKNFVRFILKMKEINIFCYHHFLVGDLNKSYNFNRSINLATKNIVEVFKILKKKKCKNIVYTSTTFEKVPDHDQSLNNDMPRYNYGFAKAILKKILIKLCKDHQITFKNFIIYQPYGIFEKVDSLSNYVFKCFKNNKKIILNFPKRRLKIMKVDEVAQGYFRFIFEKKQRKVKIENITVEKFKNKMLYYLKKESIKNKFWKHYVNYYQNLIKN